MSLSTTIRSGLTMFNIAPLPETHKSKGDGQPGSVGRGLADPLSIEPVAAAISADLVFCRKVQRVLAKGERPIVELLAEIGVRYGLTVAIDQLLDRYEHIPDEALDVANGRDLPSAPVYDVSQLLRSAS